MPEGWLSVSTSKVPVTLRLPQELVEKLHKLHPSYGEASKVVRELVEAYLSRVGGKSG